MYIIFQEKGRGVVFAKVVNKEGSSAWLSCGYRKPLNTYVQGFVAFKNLTHLDYTSVDENNVPAGIRRMIAKKQKQIR